MKKVCRVKNIWMMVCIVLVLIFTTVYVNVVSAESVQESQIEISEKAQAKQSTINDSFEKHTGLDSEEVIDSITNGDADFMKQISDVFFGEVKSSLGILLQILAIAIVQSLLNNSDIGARRTTLDVAALACTACIVATSITNVSSVFIESEKIITSANEFLHATFPAMVSLAAMAGNAGATVAVSPMLFFVAETVVSLMSTVVFPLLSASLAFAAAEVFVDKKVLKGVAAFIRKTCYWVIGMMTVVFTAVTAIKGIVGGAAAIGSSKILKSFIKFIPVVGDMAADSLETIVGGLSVIKSVSGVMVIAGVAIIVAIPILKMFAIGMIYKMAGMLTDAIGAQQGATFVKEAGNTIVTAASMVIAVGIMFVVVIAAIVSATSI